MSEQAVVNTGDAVRCRMMGYDVETVVLETRKVGNRMREYRLDVSPLLLGDYKLDGLERHYVERCGESLPTYDRESGRSAQ